MANFADMIDQGFLGELTKAFTEPVNSSIASLADEPNHGTFFAKPLQELGEACGLGGRR